MAEEEIGCGVVADRHPGVSERVRSLLETTFKAVVMVADEVSLFESARRLPFALAVVDLSLTPGDGLQLLRRLQNLCPKLQVIVVSVYDEVSLSTAAFEAGARGFVLKWSIVTDLLPAVDMVMRGQRYVSPAMLKQEVPSNQNRRPE